MKQIKTGLITFLIALSGFAYGQDDREARSEFIQEVLYKAETAAETEKAYKELVKRWPRDNYGENDQMTYDYALGSLTRKLADEGKTEEAIQYLGQLRERFWRAQAYSPVADILLRQGDTANALPLIRTALDDALYYINLPDEQQDNKAGFAAVGYPGYVGQLVGIHLNRGQHQEALTLMEEAIANAPAAASRFSAPYARSLEAAGRKLEALQQLEILYRQGEFSHKDKMEALYLELNGAVSGFEGYLSRLHEDVIKSIREHIAGQAQDKDSPDFELLNLRGEKVSLASLRGKIVVLDFWATWCQPCIRSFPGMKAAQEHYADDESVEFLFINTWERDANYKANVAAFIERNNYPFEVLFDDQTDADGQNLAAKFGVRGIPAKFILDKNGKIRYALTGSGSNADYIKLEMIELIEGARRPLPEAVSNAITITGKLEGLADGAEIRLIPGATHSQMEAVATATVSEEGVFEIRHELSEPRLFYLRPQDGRGNLTLVLAPGEEVRIEGSFGDPVVSGSPTQEAFLERFVKPRAALDAAQGELQAKYAPVSRRLGEARKSGDSEAIAAVEASEEWIAYNKESSALFAKFDATIEKISEDYSDSFWGPMLILTHTAYLTPEFEKYYDNFSEEAKNSYYGRAFAQALFGVVGQAPGFKAQSPDGQTNDLKDIIGGEKYVLLDFWASWCVPCRNFVPELKQLAKKYEDKGLVVVSISTDKDREAWLRAVEEEQMPWLNLLDESGISDAYGVTAIPSIFLIGPDGEILFGKQSGASVSEKLQEVFGKTS